VIQIKDIAISIANQQHHAAQELNKFKLPTFSSMTSLPVNTPSVLWLFAMLVAVLCAQTGSNYMHFAKSS